jgi:hypothetical protein
MINWIYFGVMTAADQKQALVAKEGPTWYVYMVDSD